MPNVLFTFGKKEEDGPEPSPPEKKIMDPPRREHVQHSCHLEDFMSVLDKFPHLLGNYDCVRLFGHAQVTCRAYSSPAQVRDSTLKIG